MNWIKKTPKPVKIGAALCTAAWSIAFLFQMIRDGDLDVVAILVGLALTIFISYWTNLFILRIAFLPLQGAFRTARFGYRVAMVASRTGAAEEAGKATLAELDTWPPDQRPPSNLFEGLDWEEQAQKWRADMAYGSIVPALFVGALCVCAVIFGRVSIILAILGGFITFKVYLRKVNRDDQLSRAMMAYLSPRLQASVTEASAPLLVHAREPTWATGYGPMHLHWDGRQFTLDVALPGLHAAVAPLTRETYDAEENDLDFGDDIFDAGTIVSAHRHEYLARMQLTPTVRPLVMALVMRGAVCREHEVSFTIDLNAGETVTREIDAFLRLAGGLVTRLAEYTARDKGARLHFALEDACSADEEQRLLTSLYDVRKRGWVQSGLKRWLADTHGHRWLQALRMVEGADRGPLADRIVTDAELPLEDRARALGAWLEEDADGGGARVLSLLESADSAVVGYLVNDAHWHEGERWRDRGMGLGDLLGRVEAGEYTATQKVLAAALILGSAVDRSPDGDTFLALVRAAPKHMSEGHVEALETVRDWSRHLDALADETNQLFEAAVVRLQEEARSRAGQLSLASQGEEGGLTILPPEDAAADEG